VAGAAGCSTGVCTVDAAGRSQTPRRKGMIPERIHLKNNWLWDTKVSANFWMIEVEFLSEKHNRKNVVDYRLSLFIGEKSLKYCDRNW